jgi:serine/threonine protein kinase
MTPEEWEKVSEIYHAAAELDGDARSRFLDERCGGDKTLLREVESLLAASSEAGDFIAEPVGGSFAAEVLRGNGFSSGETIGHYRIVSRIGTGGMGEVFLADDTRLGRQVAIKTLSAMFDGDESFLKRFRNEARAAASLNQPHVATVYAVDEHAGRPFIALEYIDGKTLDELIPERGVDVRTFTQWFVPVASALAHAHDRGVIHRDVKPGNIMITKEGVVKILDFGLACFRRSGDRHINAETELTAAGQLLGTPSYMSPEQARGEEVDHRTDIFSLGVLMYEAITGQRPFQGDSNAEIVSNLLKSDPPAVEALNPTIPPLLSRLIGRCLQKRRRDRPQNMSDVCEVLEDLDLPPQPMPLNRSFSQRFYRQVRSGRVWPNLLGAGIVLLLALGGWLYFSRDGGPPANFRNMAIRRLSQSSYVVFAAISPDGNSLVYNTIEDNGNRSLWIRRLEDHNSLRLVESQPVEYWGGLTINRDTSQVYYITADRASAVGTLYRISALGGTQRKLASGVNDLGALSPDGKRLLFVRYEDRMRISSVNSDDGGDERVIREEDQAPENLIFRDPQYSADGRYIYYSRMDRVDGVEWWALVRIPAEGGDETVVLPRRKERINEIAVLNDGTGLVVNTADAVSKLSQLFYVSLPGGEPTRLTNDINSYFGVSVDRSGRSIVAAQRYDERWIWVGDAADPEDARSITPESNVNRLAEWTPDGRLVYDAVDNSLPHIWIMNADGSGRQQLSSNDSGDQHPRVSGDGQFIVFTSNRNGYDQVWRMNIDGSNQVLLAPVEGVTSWPRFGADGRTVFFQWTRGNQVKLGKVAIDDGSVTEVERFGDSAWAISPDGSRVAYVMRDESAARNRLAIRRLDEAEPEMVLDSSPIYLLRWRPDGNALYVRERNAGENPYATVVEYDLITAKRRIFLSTAPNYVIDLTFSPDGKRIATVRGHLSTDAVLLTAVDAG